MTKDIPEPPARFDQLAIRLHGTIPLNHAYRVTTFVPPDHLHGLLQSIHSVVPLNYGPYAKCAWWSALGTEQYEPQAGAKPTQGQIGKIERVPTVRLEFVIPAGPELLRDALRVLIGAHPWQEPAIFVDSVLITGSMNG